MFLNENIPFAQGGAKPACAQAKNETNKRGRKEGSSASKAMCKKKDEDRPGKHQAFLDENMHSSSQRIVLFEPALCQAVQLTIKSRLLVLTCITTTQVGGLGGPLGVLCLDLVAYRNEGAVRREDRRVHGARRRPSRAASGAYRRRHVDHLAVPAFVPAFPGRPSRW